MEQILDLMPLVSLSEDQTLGSGASSRLQVVLNGPVSTPPLTISFTVSGDAESGVHHTLASGSVTFAQDVLSIDVPFETFADRAGDGVRHIHVPLDEGSNRGQKRQLTIVLVNENIAPVITLTGQQEGQVRRLFARDGSPIQLDLVILPIQTPPTCIASPGCNQMG